MPEAAEPEDFVVNDVLSYVQRMINTLQRDQIVKLIINHYVDENELIAARDVLFKSAPPDLPDGRLIFYKEKDKLVGSMFEVKQRIGAAAPNKIHTCRNFRNVPPLTL